MSVQVTETTSTLRFTEALRCFLNAIARGREEDRLELHCRSEGGLGYRAHLLAIPQQPWSYLPETILRLLEDEWAARIGAAVRGRGGSDLRSLSIVFATFPISLQFSKETHWRHQPDEAAVADVLARLGSFSLAPSFILDGFREIIGVWSLSEPLTDLDRARRLQRQLAETLGASTAPVVLGIPSSTTSGDSRRIEYAADDPGAHLPLPGSIVREVGTPPPIVTFAMVAPEHVYTLDQFESVLDEKEAR